MDALLNALNQVDSRVLLLVCVVLLDAWAVGMVLSTDASRRQRWLWTGVILFCPIIGCLLWYVLGPKPDLLGGERPGEGEVSYRRER